MSVQNIKLGNAEYCLRATVKDPQHKENSWIIDLGAASHMVQNPNFFHELDCSRSGYPRFTNDQNRLEVRGSNLASVRKLASEGYKLTFEDDCCMLTKDEKMPRATPSQKRYVLTVMDDYSSYTHLYLMRHKNEAKRIARYVKGTKNYELRLGRKDAVSDQSAMQTETVCTESRSAFPDRIQNQSILVLRKRRSKRFIHVAYSKISSRRD